MPSPTQANRSLQLSTPLGDDKLLLAEFVGTEGLSQLFRFELTMWSTDAGIDPTSIVGKPVTFQVALADGTSRYFHGIVGRFVAGGMQRDLRLYRAEVVPSLWLLTHTRNCRIFQNQTILQIVQKVLDDYSSITYQVSDVTGSHPTLDYCVQYDESDFQFVSRLMEREGIFYYFKFADGQHTLVLADSNATFQDGTPSKLPFNHSSARQTQENGINSWEHSYDYRSGKWTQTDYNFIDNPPGTAKTPADNLLTTQPSSLGLADSSQYEIYNYPGRYQQTSDGTTYTQTRRTADDAAYHFVRGTSYCASLTTGTKFTLDGYEIESENGKKYILTSISHRAQEGAAYPLTSRPHAELVSYENSFTCIADSVDYRPLPVTSRPSVRGSQTAVVTGPSGEEIYTDKYGRVKVQFFWDRVGVRDENTSCWVRCAQSVAGKNWGALFIPRIGQEVVVNFVDGDPDRPLITGVVYNGGQLPAYTLPDEMTKSYIKSNSSKGGDGYNEVRFEDLAGSEQIFVHAQKNMDQRVLNDRMENVLNNRHLIVGSQDENGNNQGNQYEKVFVNKEQHVLADRTVQVEGNVQTTVGKGQNQNGGNVDVLIEKKKTETIEGDHDFHLKGDLKEQYDKTVSRTVSSDSKQKISGTESLDVAGDQKLKTAGVFNREVTGDRNEKIGGAFSLDVGSDQNEKIGGSLSQNISSGLKQKVGQAIAVEAGTTVYIKGTSKVVIEGGMEVSLVASGNFVTVGPGGVAISGSMVQINSGGAAGSGSPPSPTAPTAPDAPDAPDAPQDAQQAQPTDPTDADDSETGTKSAPDSLT